MNLPLCILNKEYIFIVITNIQLPKEIYQTTNKQYINYKKKKSKITLSKILETIIVQSCLYYTDKKFSASNNGECYKAMQMTKVKHWYNSEQIDQNGCNYLQRLLNWSRQTVGYSAAIQNTKYNSEKFYIRLLSV